MKNIPQNGKKIFANEVTNKGLISKIQKQLMHFKKKKISKQTFIKRRHADGQKAHEKMSISLVIREMKIEATVRNQFTLNRMAIIKKYTNNKCWRGFGENGILIHC